MGAALVVLLASMQCEPGGGVHCRAACYAEWQECWQPVFDDKMACEAACEAKYRPQINECDAAEDRCTVLGMLHSAPVCMTGPAMPILACSGPPRWVILGGVPMAVQRCLPMQSVPWTPCGWADKDDDGRVTLRDYADWEADNWRRINAHRDGRPFIIWGSCRIDMPSGNDVCLDAQRESVCTSPDRWDGTWERWGKCSPQEQGNGD